MPTQTLNPALCATIAVRNAESDQRISREKLIDEAEFLATRLARLAAELRETGECSIVDLAVVRDSHDISVACQRYMQANATAGQLRALVTDLGFPVADRIRVAAPIALEAQLAFGGWGCPDPRDPMGDFLSDGHATPQAAVAAAKLAVAADVEVLS